MSIELNKIHLGDAYELIKKLPDKSVDCVYTDIPYDFDGNVLGGGVFGTKERNYHKEYEDVSKRRGKGLATCKAKNYYENSDIAFGIDYSILDEIVRVLKKINVYIWCSKKQILDIMNYFDKLGTFYEMLVWCKTNPIPTTNNVWLSDLEYCLYFREGGVKLNDGYEYKSKFFYSPINKGDKELYNHPTIKPLELVKRHLLHTTQPGDVVLDPFMGSGTTAAACKETERKYIGFEIDETYHKIATERLLGLDQQGQISIFANFEQIELLESEDK